MPADAQSWSFDAPTGVYKSHALSTDVLEAVIANTQFIAAMDPIAGYGKNKGEAITLPRFSNLSIPDDARINEFDEIPEQTVSQSTTSITVTEFGRALPYTAFNATLSPLDLPLYLRRALEKQMRQVLDFEIADRFKQTITKYVPTGAAAGTFETGSATASATAGSNLNFYHLERLVDYANATIFMPGDMKMLYAATKAVRGLKQDPKFEVWNQYTNRDAKVRGEVGVIEGVRVIEVNSQGGSADNLALRNDLGTGSVLGECLLIGEDAGYMAVAHDPEIMVYKSSFDGRRYSIAWYGIMEFGLKWAGDSANAGEANVIHVASA